MSGSPGPGGGGAPAAPPSEAQSPAAAPRRERGGAPPTARPPPGSGRPPTPRPGGLGGGQVGEMHRLLGVARTAEGALAAAPAADDVPMDRLTVETEGVDSLIEELGVPSDDLPRHGPDADRALHLVEVGRHGGGVRALHTIATFPLAEYAIRCPGAGAGVDDRRPAHALASG